VLTQPLFTPLALQEATYDLPLPFQYIAITITFAQPGDGVRRIRIQVYLLLLPYPPPTADSAFLCLYIVFIYIIFPALQLPLRACTTTPNKPIPCTCSVRPCSSVIYGCSSCTLTRALVGRIQASVRRCPRIRHRPRLWSTAATRSRTWCPSLRASCCTTLSRGIIHNLLDLRPWSIPVSLADNRFAIAQDQRGRKSAHEPPQRDHFLSVRVI
jgi:hypothetical protein